MALRPPNAIVDCRLRSRGSDRWPVHAAGALVLDAGVTLDRVFSAKYPARW